MNFDDDDFVTPSGYYTDPNEYPECAHSWVAGMMVVHPEDLGGVASKRRVECSKCEKVAKAGEDF